MYTISEVTELGNAQELIQASGPEKIVTRFDDDEDVSLPTLEAFDE